MTRPIVLPTLTTLLLLSASAAAQETAFTPVEIPSNGFMMKGRFYPSSTAGSHPTVMLIPGWPGNPRDVLGLSGLLVERGINVFMFNPRGMHESTGTLTFANAQEDIGSAFRWLRSPEIVRRFHVDTALLAIGGHSWGGGMALAYAARDANVRRVISIAGTDHAWLIRELDRNPALAAEIRTMLLSTQAPAGPVHFDLEGTMEELRRGTDVYGLPENADRLKDRAIIIFGGWEDTATTVEQNHLPLYRALKQAGAQDVTFLVYHDGHNFERVRAQLAAAIADWMLRGVSGR